MRVQAYRCGANVGVVSPTCILAIDDDDARPFVFLSTISIITMRASTCSCSHIQSHTYT